MPNAQPITFHESKIFAGNIWRMMAASGFGQLAVETRNGEQQLATFSVFDIPNRRWLLNEFAFDEPWWITLCNLSRGILLLTTYDDTNNPDKKSTVAFDIAARKIAWWRNSFVVAYVTAEHVIGQDAKFGSSNIAVDLISGNEVNGSDTYLQEPQNFSVTHPLQYSQGSAHFATVEAFILRKLNFNIVKVVEYLELNSMIIVSCFVGEDNLANYLIVFNSEGDIVLKEQLGENLTGIAVDTFFLFEGFLIFVKNKRELVSYKIA